MGCCISADTQQYVTLTTISENAHKYLVSELEIYHKNQPNIMIHIIKPLKCNNMIKWNKLPYFEFNYNSAQIRMMYHDNVKCSKEDLYSDESIFLDSIHFYIKENMHYRRVEKILLNDYVVNADRINKYYKMECVYGILLTKHVSKIIYHLTKSYLLHPCRLIPIKIIFNMPKLIYDINTIINDISK